MTTLGQAFHAEVSAKVGQAGGGEIPDREPTWADVAEAFPGARGGPSPTTAALAEAMGFGAAGEHRKGSAAYRRRQGFMGQVRRWRAGGINPMGKGKWAPRLREAVRTTWRRGAVLETERAVLEAIAREGMVVHRVAAFLGGYITRRRDIPAKVVVRPWQLEEAGFLEAFEEGGINWRMAGEAALFSWAWVYGIESDLFESGAASTVEAFSFTLGIPTPVPSAYFDRKRRPGTGRVA